ncbi:peptidase T [Mobilicoccus pelagius]|uniref:Peptidase T n=1 Tax=Mobilicoccus pelagius NBRC 104925 TaxID=1089455 RepID=H5UQV8_9MICO|nr:peptidase T [Mobilicoccus pelagius]GAB48116.1 peptidase T [Mobilicoccus pelagius NBRC 104925]
MSVDTRQRLVERFLRYSAISSQSDASVTAVPTSPGQWRLAELLRDELATMGASDVHLSQTACVTARVPARLPEGHAPVPAIGFCAHLDTVDVDLSPEVHAHVVTHDGGDVRLHPERDAWIRRDEHPELDAYVGDDLLVGDGTSVLGADDKAAIAAVMEAVVRLLADDPLVHGDVYVAFVPDEEIGLRGVRTLDLARFPVRYAYTIDCCEVGELVAETFNAASATVRITGVSAHPMSAKGILVNPVLVALDVVARLDREQTPERTEGREGFVWVTDLHGNQSTAEIDLSIRDHDRNGFAAKKRALLAAVEETRRQHPRAVIEVEIVDVYGNIADALTDENRVAVDHLHKAMATLGVEPRPLAMRGGTDGSWLSQQGILTPNFFTGAHNFHGPAEFLPLSSFEKSHAMVLELVRQAADAGE